MWEISKREPNFETLNKLSDIFDRRIDYILGYSNDSSSVKQSEEDIEQLGIWEVEASLSESIMDYLRLDSYGKMAVESVIKSEIARCKDQDTLFPDDNFRFSLRIRKDTSE